MQVNEAWPDPAPACVNDVASFGRGDLRGNLRNSPVDHENVGDRTRLGAHHQTTAQQDRTHGTPSLEPATVR